MRARVIAWLEPRIGLSRLRALAAHKTVPIHRWSAFYFFGGMALFFLGVQVVTGVLLALYYRPGADSAFESVELVMTTVPFGWLVRSVHAWSANLMVFCCFAHLGSVFFLKSYRAPRELTWLSGVLLLFITLGFGFSGYLLPWNRLSFYATQVGTDIAGTVPVIGHWLLRFLRGGDRVTGATLARFYGWHVCVLPAILIGLLGAHLALVQVHGMSVPPGARRAEETASDKGSMPFLPNFLLRELFGWTLAVGALATLAALFPWELGDKADPFAPAYRDIRPEWYFVFMFETLKLVPGGEILGVETEALAVLGFAAGGLLLALVPFLDRAPADRHGPVLTGVGAAVVAYAVTITAWGYRSFVPVGAALAPFLVAAAIGMLRRRKAEA